MFRRRRRTSHEPQPATPAPRRALCYAPFASMHLDPRGDVRACCQNTWQKLGNVTTRSLREIWTGEEANRLRDRLLADDLGLGCELCAVEYDMGSPESAYLHNFEGLRHGDEHPEWPRQLEMALSIACNLQCIMCNGELSSSIRIHREGRPALTNPYGDEFFEQLAEFVPHLETVTFLGGEPFMGAEPLRAMDMLIDAGHRPRCHVNTNGTQWNDRVRRVIAELPVNLAVSVDGYTREIVEPVRVGVDHDMVRANVAEMHAAIADTDGTMSLTFCMMRQNYMELVDVCEWGDRLDVDVTVNTVTHPPGASLHHLSHPELERILSDLSAQRTRAEALGRNRGVWFRELERCNSVLTDRPPPTPVAAPTRSPDAPDVDTAVMTVDGSQVITDIGPDPSSVLGIDARPLIGAASDQLMTALIRAHGRLERSSLEFHDDGREERVFRLVSGTTPTTIRATMTPTVDGERWDVVREATSAAAR